MHMLRRIRNSLALIALILSAPCAIARHAPVIVVDTIGIQHESGRVVLVMSVTNCSPTALHADAGNMPWGENTIGLTLRQASEMPGGEFRQLIPLRHSPPNEVVIPPWGRIRGSIDLTERFPDLSPANKNERFVLFWTYNTALLAKNGGHQVSGILNYPDDPTSLNHTGKGDPAGCSKSSLISNSRR